MNHISKWARALSGIALVIMASCGSGAHASAATDQQRRLFPRIEAALQAGDRTLFERHRKLMASYPLYPYLEFADLKARIDTASPEEIRAYLSRHGDEAIGVLLRKTWLAQQAQAQRWPEYQAWYVNTLDDEPLYYCRYLWAKHQTGDATYAFRHASKIWLTAEELPSVCDPLIKAWRDTGALTPELVWQRFNLTVTAGNLQLASALAALLPEGERDDAALMVRLYDQPRGIRQKSAFNRRTPHATDLVTLALTRLAGQDADAAAELWRHYQSELPFDPGQRRAIEVAVGRQYATRGDDIALAWLQRATEANPDPQLVEWQVRVALRGQRWQPVYDGIARLPGEIFETNPMWQYWRARSAESLGLQAPSAREQPEQLYRQLARQRNYYGFLAADRTNQHYAMSDASQLSAPVELKRAINARAALRRASEFIALDDNLRARREWNYLLKHGSSDDRLAAAQAAYQWGWYREAIRATARTDNSDNLALRFPVAFRPQFERAAQTVGLPAPWLMAITRQESAFAPDARSPVGASGLMQLMPRTAQQMAQQQGLQFSPDHLLNPDYNIGLGSSYLDHLYERFEGNRVLATAAYNAGPSRVKKWLQELPKESVPADVWIEAIPYAETRNYVQNVLTYSAIYGHRLGRKQSVLPSPVPGPQPKPLAAIKG